MMKLQLALGTTLLITGCWNPANFSFEMAITNNTRVSSFNCETWHKIGDNIIKAICHVDNKDASEKRPIVLRAYDANGFELGNAFIGKATIGEKVRINKAMEVTRLEKPASMVLEVTAGNY